MAVAILWLFSDLRGQPGYPDFEVEKDMSVQHWWVIYYHFGEHPRLNPELTAEARVDYSFYYELVTELNNFSESEKGFGDQ
jgi:hypothetical protein